MPRVRCGVWDLPGSPGGPRDDGKDSGGVGPGDLRKGEGARQRGSGGGPDAGLPVWCGLRACRAVTVSLLNSLEG